MSRLPMTDDVTAADLLGEHSHEDTYFDRTLCSCGSMHTRCRDCGEPLDEHYDPPAHRPGDPVVKVDQLSDGIHVRVTAGSADIWVRVTPRGRRMSFAIEEGDGDVDVQWSIRRASLAEPIVQTGPFVQSPYRVER